MSTLYSVFEIEIGKPHAERELASNLTEENAEAFINIAVFRRGVETHFFTKRPTTPASREGTQDMSEFDPANLERGDSGWASSEEDGGPDVGHFIGLGGGAWLWVGEISDAEHDSLTEGHKELGGAGDWWIVMHTADGKRLTLGKAVAGYGGDTSEFIDHLCSKLRAPAEKERET